IFRDLDPRVEQKGGPALRVQLGERLDLAAALLDGEAVGDPLMVAQLQHTLGATQRELGYPQKAIGLLTRAHRTREALLCADHLDTLSSLGSLGLAYQAAGQLDKALPLLEHVLARRKAHLGPDHPDTVISMSSLAAAYEADGQLAKAGPLFEQTLA